MRTVLIIDDEPWAREAVKALGEWSRLGLTVAGEAEDGAQGLGLIERLKPDIVVTDMRMPGVDGAKLLQAMHERYPTLKMIVMSGYDDFAYLKQAIQSRAVEYMLKPIDPDELNGALERCVRELEEAEQTISTSWRSPLALPDAVMMERYLLLRQRLFGSLFELNKPGALQALDKLEELLRAAYPDGADGPMLRQIYADGLRTLREFMAEQRVETPVEASRGTPKTAEAVVRALAAAYVEAIDRTEASRPSKAKLAIAQVARYIDEHYADPITLESIALRFYVSKEHLSRSFKSTTGENVSDYIVRKRIERAMELLAVPGMATKDVARTVGYPELAYFHRIFKKRTGKTPGEYRAERCP
ncbi:response regulator [Paenibacillus antri]|uniref:Response regulator n=1 Tax=Paenibacillus antri TaxID=2582848 RepID=A0A5R9GE67_9BACL|nr:response regulator [Paenibacillus antri]TLS51638.1 response regulator [Paenibacillus antri]